MNIRMKDLMDMPSKGSIEIIIVKDSEIVMAIATRMNKLP